MKFNKMNPTLIIAIGGIIILIGTGISIYGAYLQGIESSEQTNRIEGKLNQETAKLAYPLPTEFKIEWLTLVIKSDVLKKFIPELKKKLRNFSHMTNDEEEGFQLPSGQYSEELQNMFDGKILKISLQMAEEFYTREEAHKNNLYWNYQTKISLKDHNSTLHYKIKNTNGEDSFELNLFNSGSDRSQQSDSIRVFNGISSALDLCNKKVWMFIDIGNNTDLRVPDLNIKNLKIRDNNNKDYEIEITGVKTYIDDYLNKKLPNKNMPIIKESYLSGIIRCKSF